MTAVRETVSRGAGPEPLLLGEKTATQLFLVKVFAIVPLLALVAAVPFAWDLDLREARLGVPRPLAEAGTPLPANSGSNTEVS